MQIYDIKYVNSTLEHGLINFAICQLCLCSFYALYYFPLDVVER